MKNTKKMKKKVDTCIGQNTKFVGDIISKASVIIEGSIEGNIECEGEININKVASVQGNVTATNVTVSGKITGNIQAQEYVKLTMTSVIDGDIHTKNFIADEGSLFNGKCFMTSTQESPKKSKS